MKKVRVVCPGKLMLLGEHAVVYGYPCIATAIDKHLTVTVEEHGEENDSLITPQVTNQTFVKTALAIFRRYYPSKQKYKIQTESELGASGLGSSAATVVAVTKSLTQMQEIQLTREQLFDLCFEIVLAVQKKGSGFDVAASIYGGTLFFDGKTKKRELLTTDPLPLVVGYTGIKADTVALMHNVEEKKKSYPEAVDKIFESIGELVYEGKKAISEKDWKRLGTLFTFNQNYLEELGVSTGKLNALITASIHAGAYGAKLSGAGGGDCMIALGMQEKKEKIEEAIRLRYAELVTCQTSAQGVYTL